MHIDEQALEAIDALYAAALDGARWPEALRRLTEVTGSQAASFWVLDGGDPPRLPVFEYQGFDDAFIAEYLASVAPSDPTVQYLLGHPELPVVHDGLVITEREKDRHAYYDWHGRHSETRFRMVGQCRPGGGMQAGVALHRTRRAGRYEPADLERFGVLHRHLERALAVGFRLASLGVLQRCCEELLDRSADAVVLLDERGRVVHANARAAALREASDGILVAPEGLSLASPRDDARLKRLVAQALASRGALTAPPGGAMRAARPSGPPAFSVLVTPLSRRAAGLGVPAPAVCVAISDPARPARASPERLQAAYGLTGAEARLAARLASGETLRQAAAALGVTYGTARTRLAQVFQKTGARRQSELVRLVVTGPASAPGP